MVLADKIDPQKSKPPASCFIPPSLTCLRIDLPTPSNQSPSNHHHPPSLPHTTQADTRPGHQARRTRSPRDASTRASHHGSAPRQQPLPFVKRLLTLCSDSPFALPANATKRKRRWGRRRRWWDCIAAAAPEPSSSAFHHHPVLGPASVRGQPGRGWWRRGRRWCEQCHGCCTWRWW